MYRTLQVGIPTASLTSASLTVATRIRAQLYRAREPSLDGSDGSDQSEQSRGGSAHIPRGGIDDVPRCLQQPPRQPEQLPARAQRGGVGALDGGVGEVADPCRFPSVGDQALRWVQHADGGDGAVARREAEAEALLLVGSRRVGAAAEAELGWLNTA
eukprot:gene10602-biopygen4238